MTNEEIQRMMEFIIKRQESFAEGMERMRESHAQSEARISQLEAAAVHLYNAATDLYKAQEKLAAKMIDLAEAQAHTEQRLNALIDVVEQGRGGTSKG